MKRIVILMAAAMLCGSVMAQNAEKVASDRLTKLMSRTEMQKANRQRQPQKVDPQMFQAPEGVVAYNKMHTKGVKAAGDTVWASQMPEKRWFPGEWEEVQAIVVTFPYISYPADHAGDEDYTATMYLPGYGANYHYQNNDWAYIGWGPVTGVPDTTDYDAEIDYYTSLLSDPQYSIYASEIRQYIEYFQRQKDFRNVFISLIHGIQRGAQVWITVWQYSDSVYIKNMMAAAGKPLTNYRFIENYTDAFWYRDCGPICFYYGDQDSVAMLNFNYSGRALDDLLPDSISAQTGIPNYTTTIEWEGGNCLVDGVGKLFTSDATYDENADTYGQLYYTGNANNPVDYRYKQPLTKAQVADSMARMIGTAGTYILPRFQYDGGTGHVDLYADMLDENLFIFSQMPEAYSSWTDYRTGVRNMDSLCSIQSFFGANFRSRRIPFPSTDDGSNFANQRSYDKSYTRTYSNHTFVNDVILQPCFSEVGTDGLPTAAWDLANIVEVMKAYPGYKFHCIDVRTFDGSGGAIHCITKQIPAEHPIRILHQALHDNTGTTYSSIGAPILARITSADSIDSAVVWYRIGDGQWNRAEMTPDAVGQYAAVIPTSGQLHGDFTRVEYYIAATSRIGKTVTKPMTAANGGYYTFYLGENPNVGVERVESEERFGQFYPNPAGEVAQMQIDLGEGGSYGVFIVDAAGRTVHTSSLQAAGSILYTINTAKLPSGIYSVVFQNGSDRVVRRLIVK